MMMIVIVGFATSPLAARFDHFAMVELPLVQALAS